MTMKRIAYDRIVSGASDPIYNLLAIDFSDPNSQLNRPHAVNVEDASRLTASPVTSGAFYAYRLVFQTRGENSSLYHTLVILLELWPVMGRVWSNLYNKDVQNWYGWKSLTPS